MSRPPLLSIKQAGKKKLVRNIALAVVLSVLTGSFIYGWYFDHSKQAGAYNWADQYTYLTTSDRLAHHTLPVAGQLHFQIGYPLLGVVGHVASSADPFMMVSLLLLLGSAVFCFLAAEKLFGAVWAVLFCVTLFAWDGYARSFQYASDLFAVPWNNQVLFFTMAFYLWLMVTRTARKPSYKLVVVTGLVSGLCFLSRQETILFILPMLAAFVWFTRPELKKSALLFGITFACYLPQLIIQKMVVGKALTSGRQEGYGGLFDLYFRPHFLHRNAWETIIDSKHYSYLTGLNPRRPALLQAEPWLWLSPVGIGLALFIKRYPKELKAFMIISGLLILFYLSGYNMSADKLKFHCLRYISPGFIALNLGVIIVAREIVLAGRTRLARIGKKNRPSK